TVNRVDKTDFSINLIPHTVAVTTLKRLVAGSKVNLEIDLVARYIERMLTAENE
ncbi:MAG: riboflavin synthase, partial [Rhodocyclaceae bacterium]